MTFRRYNNGDSSGGRSAHKSRSEEYFESKTASQERKRLISDTDLFRASWKIANGGKRYFFNGKSSNTYDSILASEFLFFNLGPTAMTNYACNKHYIVKSHFKTPPCLACGKKIMPLKC